MTHGSRPFADVVAARRMVRNFRDEPLPPGCVDELLAIAQRGPSAGFVQATEYLVLEGSGETGRYWDITLPPTARDDFPWPGLLTAPVLCVVAVDPSAYVRRYDEPDKRASGLGASESSWPIPYWHVDGGASVMLLLLAAVDAGLGACFFGLFDHEADVADAFGIPESRRLLGTVALGHPAPDRPSSSARRGRRPLGEVVHRHRW
ncbi:MAG: nitroreductase family protein [Acidimicrobiia bacterium]|nr:nitroreductase family protein [Acidimicrobiia bacterium]